MTGHMFPDGIQKLSWFVIIQRVIKSASEDGIIRKRVWGVPRGGVHIAQLLSQHCQCELVDSPTDCEVIVDDLIDSGATREFWKSSQAKFWAPIDKSKNGDKNWYVFPWEKDDEESPEEHFRRFIQAMGGLGISEQNQIDTPKRVVKAFTELTSGLDIDPASVLNKRFAVEGLDEMVIVRDIPFASLCEHHLLPFTGLATVAYIAKNEAVGLSKIPRLVHCFARRPQMQERLAQQIASTIMEQLDTVGAACFIRGSHTCMKIRGIQSDGEMVTSAMLGLFRDDSVARSEFLSLTK